MAHQQGAHELREAECKLSCLSGEGRYSPRWALAMAQLPRPVLKSFLPERWHCLVLLMVVPLAVDVP